MTQREPNEAAERLREALSNYSQISADGKHWFNPEKELAAALAHERSAGAAPHEHIWTASSRPGPWPGTPGSCCADPHCPDLAERSARADPPDGRTNEQQMIDGDRLPVSWVPPRSSAGAAPTCEDCGVSLSPVCWPCFTSRADGRSAGAAQLDVERLAEAMSASLDMYGRDLDAMALEIAAEYARLLEGTRPMSLRETIDRVTDLVNPRLSEVDWDAVAAALAHERSTGAAPLDVERLTQAYRLAMGWQAPAEWMEVVAAEYKRLAERTDR